MINYKLLNFTNRLIILAISILSIPVFYLIFTPYTYGYGLNFYGVFLYFSPLLLLIAFKVIINNTYKKKEIKLHAIAHPKLPVWLLFLAYFGLFAYAYGVVLDRIGDVNIFDIRSLYLHFGSDGDSGNLSFIGLLGVLFVPISFILFAVSKQFSWSKKIILMLPVMVFVTLNLLLAKRQLSLYFIFFLLSIVVFTVSKVNTRVLIKSIFGILLFLFIVMGVGFQRSGFDTVETQLEQNQHGESESISPLLGLTWGYVGSGPEFLSIITDNVEPVYLPFSTTNSFILRRINSITDYVDYERDIVPKTTDVVENITGLFARSWAGGVLQVYIEGGLFLIIAWYFSLILWLRYICYRFVNGFDVLLDTTFFGSTFLMYLFVFPFKDQNLFLAFFWYLLVVLLRHVRYGRLKIKLGI